MQPSTRQQAVWERISATKNGKLLMLHTQSSEQLQLCQVSPGPVVVLAWCHPPPTTVYQRFLGTGPAWPEEFFSFDIAITIVGKG